MGGLSGWPELPALPLETRMNTKRCPGCQKLLRAETGTCSRCGYVFVGASKQPPKWGYGPSNGRKIAPLIPAQAEGMAFRKRMGKDRPSYSTDDYGKPDGRPQGPPLPTAYTHAPTIHGRDGQRTILPASPQRAGHYAGLHPEDQPYQSTMLSVQQVLGFQAVARPPAQADVEPLPSPKTDPSIDDVPTYVMPRAVRERTPLPPVAPRSRGRKRVLSLVLVLLCLFLLLAGSFTAYVLMNKGSAANTLVLTAQPNQLRVGDALTLVGRGFG
ncbi:MAG TPA: hypothetical protein VNE61_08350, partial [Ktedonobacteraceae bacterium]|nr:hypothetical protein [Ktedonobacteraceae bacterium]